MKERKRIILFFMKYAKSVKMRIIFNISKVTYVVLFIIRLKKIKFQKTIQKCIIKMKNKFTIVFLPPAVRFAAA